VAIAPGAIAFNVSKEDFKPMAILPVRAEPANIVPTLSF
jgi:hypothetical protein